MKKWEKVFIICSVVIIVSVAVIFYLWQDALILTFPSEGLYAPKITGVTFQTGTATISVINVGVSDLSISAVTVDDLTKPVLATGGSLTGSGPYDLDKGESGTITIGLSWTSGNSYTFAVITTQGYKVAYRATAP